MNGLEPYQWLKDTLEKLPTWPNANPDELLPLALPPTGEALSEKTSAGTEQSVTPQNPVST
jgi:hypothetical protein